MVALMELLLPGTVRLPAAGKAATSLATPECHSGRRIGLQHRCCKRRCNFK
jgi:hypothetical protein